VQELLQIAEEQATDITRQAVQEADRLSAQVHAEINELRQSATAELAQMRDAQLAELDSLRHHSERDAAELRDRAAAEAEQLLSSARLQADAVRTEGEAAATGMRKAATFESQQLLAGAERDSAAVRQQVADQRERVLAELRQAQESANQSIQAMLAEATELQRAAGERLTQETEYAAKLRTDTFAAAERIKVDARGASSGRGHQQPRTPGARIAAASDAGRTGSAQSPKARHAQPAHVAERPRSGDG
jgi:ribosomal protein L3